MAELNKKYEWMSISDGRMLRWDGVYVDFIDINDEAPMWIIDTKAAAANIMNSAVRIYNSHGRDPLPSHLLESAQVLIGDDGVRADNWRLMMFAFELWSEADEIRFR